MHVAFSFAELPLPQSLNPGGVELGAKPDQRAAFGPVANFAEVLVSANGGASDGLATTTAQPQIMMESATENTVPTGAILPVDDHKLPVEGKIVPPAPQSNPVSEADLRMMNSPSEPVIAAGPIDTSEIGREPAAPIKGLPFAPTERALSQTTATTVTLHNSETLKPLTGLPVDAPAEAPSSPNISSLVPKITASEIARLTINRSETAGPVIEPLAMTGVSKQTDRKTHESNHLPDQMKPSVGAPAQAALTIPPRQSGGPQHQNPLLPLQEISGQSEIPTIETGTKQEGASTAPKSPLPISQQAAVPAPQPVPILQPIVSAAPQSEPQIRDAQPLERLVETITQMRESGQAGRSEVSLRHSEFGTVAMRVSSSDGEIQARLTSRDPGFVTAAQIALNDRAVSASAETNQASTRQQDSGHSGHSNSRDLSGSAQNEQGRRHAEQQSSGPANKGEHGAVSLAADDHTQRNSASETRSAGGLFA